MIFSSSQSHQRRASNFSIVASSNLPAKPIRKRFEKDTIAQLEALRWWDWDEEKIKRGLPAIQAGDIAALAALGDSGEEKTI